MSFRDLVRDTLQTLMAHKLRAGLTMFGLMWGIVSIMLMTAAGDGFREGQRQVAANFGENIFIVFPGRTSMQAGGERAGRRVMWTVRDHELLRPHAPSCEHILPELTRSAVAVRSDYNAGSLLVSGSQPPYQRLRALTVAEGRFFSWEDEAQGRRVAFLGADAKKQLFGARNAIGESISIAGFPYLVIGVMQFKDQDSSYDGRDVNKVFVPFSAMIRDLPQPPPWPPDTVDQLIVKARTIEQHEACVTEVRRGLARLHRFDPEDTMAAAIWDTVRESRAFKTMTDGMKHFLGAIGVVTLLLGGIGTMNVMLVAVRERTREIGLRMSVGATRRQIQMMFFLETALIVFSSGALGMGFALAVCHFVNKLPMPQYFAGLMPSWEVGAACAALLGLVAFLSALYPASRAASIDPVQALHFEAGG
ncbi:MAG: multidrug ABC transporter substrate-binding protein [Bryobacteraceae bacterium]|nr:MAG: multidrug ABC transporter substrate-binding protein [Bryobacteraceae bacterium]